MTPRRGRSISSRALTARGTKTGHMELQRENTRWTFRFSRGWEGERTGRGMRSVAVDGELVGERLGGDVLLEHLGAHLERSGLELVSPPVRTVGAQRTFRSWKAEALTFLFSSNRSTTSRYDHPTSCERRCATSVGLHADGASRLRRGRTLIVQNLRPGFNRRTRRAEGTTIFFLRS